MIKKISFIAALLFSSFALAKPASVSVLSPNDLVDFDKNPKHIKQLIRKSLALTKKNLTYQYGSNSPKNRGMDCSGVTQHTLKQVGMLIPRQANQQHRWLQRQGKITTTKNVHSFNNKQLKKLKPGDMMFWSGTYKINRHVTHTMIYLGIEKKTGRPVMFGSSDGRRHNGKRITGVSVFDFSLPAKGRKSKFVGYGSLPFKQVATAKSQQKVYSTNDDSTIDDLLINN